MKYPLTWDLDSIFPGGSHSKELQDKLVVIEEDVKAYFNLNESWEPASDKPHYQTFQTLIDAMVSNIAYEYSKDKIDKVPGSTPGNVSVFDNNHGLQDSGVDILTLLNSGGGGSSEIETTESLDDLRNYDDGVYVNVGDFPWEISVGDDNYCTRRIIQHKIGTYIENNSHTVQIGLCNPLINIDLNDNECKLCYRICEVSGDNSEWFELNAGGESGGGSGSSEIEIESDSLDYLGYLNDGVYVKLGDPWIIDFGVESYITRRIINRKIDTMFGSDTHILQIGLFDISSPYNPTDVDCKLLYRIFDRNTNNASEWFSLNSKTTTSYSNSPDNLLSPGEYICGVPNGWYITVDQESVIMRTVEVFFENDRIYQRGLCYGDEHTFYTSRSREVQFVEWTDWVKE